MIDRRLLLAALLAACGAVPAVPERSPSLEDLRWVLGAWETAPDERGCVAHERWSAGCGAGFVGAGDEVCPEGEPFVETIALEQRGESIVYVASPRGQERAEFVLTSVRETGFVAENPTHDFPTRIAYRLSAPGVMEATVSGPERSFTLTFRPDDADIDVAVDCSGTR